LSLARDGFYSSTMAQRSGNSSRSRTGAAHVTPAAPQPEDLAQPDDVGLSLEELGQAYAAVLGKGADPYPQPGEPSPPAIGGLPETIDEPAETTRGTEAACEITPRSILEAILFVGHPTGEPLTSERIAALMRGVRPAEIDDLVRELNEQYAAEGTCYAIVSVGPGYQLALRPEFAPLRDHFYGRLREARLSQAAVDILAIVAYHQPIAADEIDRLRTKPSGHILSQLVRRDLLRIDRPAEKKTRPVYWTTDRFLDLFGLEDLQELPRSQDIDREL
jgi:segregation and condensation protein B